MKTPENTGRSVARESGEAASREQECVRFQQGMAERIAAGDDIEADEHLKNCSRCRELLNELETIAQAARMLFPVEEEPDDKVWRKIEQAIASDRS